MSSAARHFASKIPRPVPESLSFSLDLLEPDSSVLRKHQTNWREEQQGEPAGTMPGVRNDSSLRSRMIKGVPIVGPTARLAQKRLTLPPHNVGVLHAHQREKMCEE